MVSKKDLLIIANLRNNARATLTMISKRTNIPISTIYDRLKNHSGGLIKKHTTLLDFSKLGFNTRANITLKVDRKIRDDVKNFLIKHQNINSVYKINNGYDFLIEAIFKHIKDLEDFMELMEEKFKIKSKQVYYVIDEIKRENFLTDPNMIDMVN